MPFANPKHCLQRFRNAADFLSLFEIQHAFVIIYRFHTFLICLHIVHPEQGQQQGQYG